MTLFHGAGAVYRRGSGLWCLAGTRGVPYEDILLAACVNHLLNRFGHHVTGLKNPTDFPVAQPPVPMSSISTTSASMMYCSIAASWPSQVRAKVRET